MKRTNPIAATVQPLAGRSLPSDWQRQAAQNHCGNYDQRDLENLWRTPQWSAKQNDITNIQQAARLTQPTWSELFGSR